MFLSRQNSKKYYPRVQSLRVSLIRFLHREIKMANQQYDVPKKLQRLFEEKQKIRQAIRQLVLKRETSPYVQPNTTIDPAIIRFHAMLNYRIEHLKINPKNLAGFMGFIVIPFLGILSYTVHCENEKEKLYRSGKVAYKDRFQSACL